MVRLCFIGWPHSRSYAGEHVPDRVFAKGSPVNPAKPSGEKHDGLVEVTEAGAAYLLEHFGDAFTRVETPKTEPKAESQKSEAKKEGPTTDSAKPNGEDPMLTLRKALADATSFKLADLLALAEAAGLALTAEVRALRTKAELAAGIKALLPPVDGGES